MTFSRQNSALRTTRCSLILFPRIRLASTEDAFRRVLAVSEPKEKVPVLTHEILLPDFRGFPTHLTSLSCRSYSGHPLAGRSVFVIG